jgi:acetyltransferase
MTVRNLEFLFHPASVALIGASDREGSVGKVLLRNLRQGGFMGPIWPVNPRHALIEGEQAWPDVAALPQAPDLALICTPPPTVPGLIADLGARGTRAAIVITAGLKQAQAQGGTLEQAMLDAARPHLLRILGPNCIGALVPAIGLNASFAPGNARAGKLAFITQSGALATAMLDWANERGIGFSHFVSLGDSADVDFGDMLDHLGSDPGTRAILMYCESVKHARKFMSAARAAARNKPVIVVKAGRAPEGAKAAASHTGALAGSDTVFDSAARRAGMLRVETLEALFDAAETLAHAQPWRGPRLALLTNGGGAGVLAADALALGGGQLAALSPATLERLSACLPATWSHGNPVDIIGDAPVRRYTDALSILFAADEVDGVLLMHAPTAIVPSGDIASACLALPLSKPLLTNWLGGAVVAQARAASAAAGRPSFSTPERAVAAWLQLAEHAHNQEALRQIPSAVIEDFKPDLALAQSLQTQALAAGQEWLEPQLAHALLLAYGIATLLTRLARDVDDACAQAEAIGYPVALKIHSPQAIHKSDVGGVALGLADASAVRKAALAMHERLQQLRPQAQLLGYTVQAMAQRPGAHELIVGIASDAVFGPVLLCGAGGVTVELHKEHAVALPPLNEALARDLLERSGVAPLLAGYRGRPAADTAALLGTLRKVAQMACDLPWLAELDINPLLVDAQGVLALDARVRLRAVAPGEASRLAILPYPAALQEQVQLDGVDLLLRPIRPEDGERLAAFYSAASPGDMRLRFFMARREVPRSELARNTQIDYDREMSLVALAPQAKGDALMVAEARALCDPDNRRAEFAIQVATDWQGRGLGRLLLDKLLRHLRERGTGTVFGQCLTENQGMAALAREAGFEVSSGDEPGLLELRMTLS